MLMCAKIIYFESYVELEALCTVIRAFDYFQKYFRNFNPDVRPISSFHHSSYIACPIKLEINSQVTLTFCEI